MSAAKGTTDAAPAPAPAHYRAPTGTSIGHVHLRVADLERSIRFYEDVLGFALQARLGDEAAFLGARMPGEDEPVYHHHIGLNTWESRGGPPASRGHAGLYHAAILFPDRAALAAAVRRVIEAGVALTGASDHGVSEAVYLDDPDGNGLELYRDRPVGDWPREPDGELAMTVGPLDLEGLLAEGR